MAAKGKKVFISYRREDASDVAGRIRDWLVQTRRIAREDIFMDVTTILPGADFLQVIEQAIGQCRAVIVVISPSWLMQVNSPDTSYVRLEADAALRHNIPVIPVLVGGAQVPSAGQLPESLRPLTRRNARPVRADSFDYDMDWVRRGLGLGTGLRPQWIAAISVLLLVALSLGILSRLPGNPISHAIASTAATATANSTATATGTTTSATATVLATPTASVVMHTNSQALTGSVSEIAVNASCTSGEQLLSGGYSVESAQGALPIMAEASYPSDINTWTAALSFYSNRTAQATLSVYTYCLKAGFPIGVHIEQSPRPDVFSGDGIPLTSGVTCPQGSALTGGGFQVHWTSGGAPPQPAAYVLASQPKSNGWSVTTESQSNRWGQLVFAVCATQNLTVSDPATHSFIAPPSASSEDSVNCPSSFQFMTGGGYDVFSHGSFGTDLFYSDHATPDTTHWNIKVYVADTGQHLGDSWAVCVGLPQHF
jgi:hypothetical protein